MGVPGGHLPGQHRHQAPSADRNTEIPEVLPSSSLRPTSTRSFLLADLHVVMCLDANSSCSISTEFLSLMRKVGKTPQIMEVLAIPQVQKLLERLSDLLTKIQKALGEYLEKERASFPR